MLIAADATLFFAAHDTLLMPLSAAAADVSPYTFADDFPLLPLFSCC